MKLFICSTGGGHELAASNTSLNLLKATLSVLYVAKVLEEFDAVNNLETSLWIRDCEILLEHHVQHHMRGT
jgi:hypothetical protein